MEILGITEAALWEVELAELKPTFNLHHGFFQLFSPVIYRRSPRFFAAMIGAFVAVLSPVFISVSLVVPQAIAATPKATPNCSIVLRRGDTGTLVRQLQTLLAGRGYKVTADGAFGDQTVIGLISFQRSVGLDPDGVYGLQTCNALTKAGTTPKTPVSNSSSGTTSQMPATDNSPLSRGSKGDRVFTLQNQLRKLGYTNVVITGTFDDQTEISVRQFQLDHQLAVDGVVGATTQTKLNAALSNVPNSTSTNNAQLSLGSKGDRVTNLQNQLIKLGYRNIAPTGIFDTQTEISVRQFQLDHQITVNGIVGSTTQTKLNQVLADAMNNGGTFNIADNSPLSWGSKGDRVIQLQNQLIKLGYRSVSPTGTFDDQTDIAVRQFQSSRGLIVDGVVGLTAQNKLDEDSRFQVITPPSSPNVSTIPLAPVVVSQYPYIVAVPSISNTTLSDVRRVVPQAQLQNSRRGQYVHAGSFQNRDSAESVSYNLRSRGFDARVISK